MPFTFVDVEASRNRRVVALFATLVAFYFLGALLLFGALTLDVGYLTPRHRAPLGAALRGGSWGWRTLIEVFVVALLVALVHWLLSVRRMIPRILDVVGARPLDPEDRRHRVLANVVAELSAATGGRRFEAVTVSSRALNAFALSDLHGRTLIGVTEGLLVRLDRRQLEAVVGHEASHVLWGDSLTTTIGCSMAAVWAGLLELSVPEGGGRSHGRVSPPVRAFPALAVILLMRGLTAALNVWLSRQREYRADATAVRLTRDPLALAGALRVIAGDGRGALPLPGALSPIFIVSPEGRQDAAAGSWSELFSTHPPAARRIAELLRLGHADERALAAAAAPPRTPPEAEEPLNQPAGAKRWYAREAQSWRGPFTAAELVALPWVTLQTAVAGEPGGLAQPAWEHPELNLQLRRRGDNAAHARGCPACAGALCELAYDGVPLRKCGSCGGRLVGRERFARILARVERPTPPEVQALARELSAASIRRRGALGPVAPGRLRCPDCGGEMLRTLYHALLPNRIEIDRCEPCGLLWLDGRELELIEHFTSLGQT